MSESSVRRDLSHYFINLIVDLCSFHYHFDLHIANESLTLYLSNKLQASTTRIVTVGDNFVGFEFNS